MDRINLPDFMIADLYKSSLVDIDRFSINNDHLAKTAAISQELSIQTSVNIDVTTDISPETIKYLGENGKQIIVIVDQPEEAYLKEDDLTFLTNILKACQLNLADIAIVNAAQNEVNFAEVKTQLNALHIILFDVEPSAIKLPFIIPAFKIQKYDDVNIMLAPALTKINQVSQEGKLLKTKLWMSLKQLFGIN